VPVYRGQTSATHHFPPPSPKKIEKKPKKSNHRLGTTGLQHKNLTAKPKKSKTVIKPLSFAASSEQTAFIRGNVRNSMTKNHRIGTQETGPRKERTSEPYNAAEKFQLFLRT
jgi:hypothetical protein